MSIFLRQKTTTNLIRQIHGGFSGLTGVWSSRAKDSTLKFPKPRQRASVYRWVKDGVPSGGDQLFAFCALLDVDPLAIFDYKRNGYFSKFASLRRNLQLGLGNIGSLAPIYELYKPGPYWPSNEVSLNIYGREWCAHEFGNAENWTTNDYAQIKVNFSEPTNAMPRAVHIAYRRAKTADTMWRYYGTVISINGDIELYSEGGNFLHMPQRDENTIQFRTYFGGRPVEFRTASLHAFDAKVEFPCEDESVVSFIW